MQNSAEIVVAVWERKDAHLGGRWRGSSSRKGVLGGPQWTPAQ